MIFVPVFIALVAFLGGSIMYFRFSKRNKRSVQSPSTSFHFFDALFFGLEHRCEMNIAAFSFLIFLLSLWGIRIFQLNGHFWGSPDSYFGLCIAGIFFLMLHCRYGTKRGVTESSGREPLKELFNFKPSGLTSPFLWLSRLGYLGWLIGIMR